MRCCNPAWTLLGVSEQVVLPQEQHRPLHRGDLWLPRELSHEARGAIHAAEPGFAAGVSSPRGKSSPARAGSGRRIRWRLISSCRARRSPVDFQISQRADHIVNDIYQWVQFNRAIINARDEPLADYRKYRRLHLLIGDSAT